MSGNALGMIETKGLVALFEATDAMLKSANVSFAGWQSVGSGLVTAFVEGRLQRKVWSPRADLDVRKLAAIEVKSGVKFAPPKGLEIFAGKFNGTRLHIVGEGGIPLTEFLSRPATDWLE